MLTFLEAALRYRETPLAAAFESMTANPRAAGSGTTAIGLGWLILQEPGTEIVWHNGGTGGFRSWAGYEPRSRTGVVVLANTFTPAGVDDIGRHLLNGRFALLQTFPEQSAPKARAETTVDPSVFDKSTGR
jgi:CubicO group peptidase (beta-lactamase class C family)